MEWLFHIKYDIDFFLAAIPLQLIMIIYYISRRHLPLRESRSFFYLMVLNLLNLMTDIIAYAVLAVSPPHTGAIYFWFLLYLLHTISASYYICFILSASFLLLYTSDALHIPDFAGRWTKVVLFLPAWVLLALLFTTPWTGYFFQSTPLYPYKNGPVYMSIYSCYIFYLVFSTFLVLFKWNENSLKRNLAFIACGFLLLIGIYLRNEFRQTLILGYFFTLAILVGYLTVRNPDFYMDEETNLLNAQAMKLVYQDRMREGNASWLGFVIRGFEQSRILYGPVFVDSFLKDIGDFIRRELGSCHGFYLRGGRFVILTPSAKLTAEAEQHIKERFQKPWVNGERTAFFDISCVTSGGDIRLPSLEEFLLVLEDSLQAAK
ncbi:hypothetical protein, partial [Dialister sp.]|uniref:hypothetical protein n=1 Tax=Dialister sp. TaxID=1955814 RepID=UPI003F0B6459